MNAVGHGPALACGDCAGSHPLPEHHLQVILLILALAVLAGAILIWQRHRRHAPRKVTDHWSALTAMGELCPHGWQAKISLQGSGSEPPTPDRPPVAVRWTLYEDDSDRVAVERRVCGETIGDALQTMVEDRRLDVTLEQIEHSAGRGEDGA